MKYEEAKKIALANKADIDRCVEYEDAYLFSSSHDEDGDGGRGPCVILKDSGQAILATAYHTDKMAKGMRPVIIGEYDL